MGIENTMDEIRRRWSALDRPINTTYIIIEVEFYFAFSTGSATVGHGKDPT
jgi:hypothetical protein